MSKPVIRLCATEYIADGQSLPRYAQHWSDPRSAGTYFGSSPRTSTGELPCCTRAPLRKKGERHLINCNCGRFQIWRPE